MSKIFFDTNILLDILLPQRANHSKAVKAFIMIANSYDTLSTSEDILTTVEYIASKNGIECEKIYHFFKGLNEKFEIYNFQTTLSESLEFYHKSCKENRTIDFEDVLQLFSAIKNGCDTFLTEDKEIKKLKLNIKVLSLEDFHD